MVKEMDKVAEESEKYATMEDIFGRRNNMYEVHFSTKAERYLKKIKDKRLKQQFKEAILKLSKNPYIGQAKKQRFNRNIWI